jgi:hypothetical protein
LLISVRSSWSESDGKPAAPALLAAIEVIRQPTVRVATAAFRRFAGLLRKAIIEEINHSSDWK